MIQSPRLPFLPFLAGLASSESLVSCPFFFGAEDFDFRAERLTGSASLSEDDEESSFLALLDFLAVDAALASVRRRLIADVGSAASSLRLRNAADNGATVVCSRDDAKDDDVEVGVADGCCCTCAKYAAACSAVEIELLAVESD